MRLEPSKYMYDKVSHNIRFYASKCLQFYKLDLIIKFGQNNDNKYSQNCNISSLLVCGQ